MYQDYFSIGRSALVREFDWRSPTDFTAHVFSVAR
jgi:hypothetical protein